MFTTKIKELLNLPRPATSYKGLNLPPFRTNQGLQDNELYLMSGVEQVRDLQGEAILNENTRLLDFGCGQGRILNSLEYAKVTIEQYYGVDTDIKSIQWCNKWLAACNTKHEFIHLPAYNARYNKKASELKQLPFQEGLFDLVFLNSVFSHMLENDVQFYLKEFYRTLANGGAIYLTAFIEENVPEVEENPKNYIADSKGALHRVRYEKDFFFRLIEHAGLSVEKFYHQKINRTGQSVVIAKKQ